VHPPSRLSKSFPIYRTANHVASVKPVRGLAHGISDLDHVHDTSIGVQLIGCRELQVRGE